MCIMIDFEWWKLILIGNKSDLCDFKMVFNIICNYKFIWVFNMCVFNVIIV